MWRLCRVFALGTIALLAFWQVLLFENAREDMVTERWSTDITAVPAQDDVVISVILAIAITVLALGLYLLPRKG
ncbi:MAG: hypothetical protein AAFX39_17305 [Pseudomonadota bacterium]